MLTETKEYNADYCESSSTDKHSHQCSNCEQIFSWKSFEEHICEYDENNQYIEDSMLSDYKIAEEDSNISATGNNKLIKSEVVPSDEVCVNFPNHNSLVKMLDTNNAAICKWLKTDYKLDLSKLIQLGENASAEQSATKKHEGPHFCTMCDRKFVHASGLSRHMDKHENDKSEGSAWSLAMKHDPGAATSLETAIKCKTCFRVFRRPEDCLKHILFGHEIEQLYGDFSDDEMEIQSEEDTSANGIKASDEVNI